MSRSVDIFDYESSACGVDLLICINGSYSKETAAQWKDSPYNAIVGTNIVRLDDFLFQSSIS